jgi:hypothetical protein
MCPILILLKACQSLEELERWYTMSRTPVSAVGSTKIRGGLAEETGVLDRHSRRLGMLAANVATVVRCCAYWMWWPLW